MGLGSTAKKLQELADVAEKLFKQLKDLRERVNRLDEDLATTTEQVGDIATEQRRQRALLEAVAEEQGVDVDGVLEAVEADIEAEAADDGADATEAGSTDATESESAGAQAGDT